ncbi:hypothetical protein [Anaerosporobacter faecicola]|uniref:hypothetical protein n=1 Tax=Anaerosporobacter faecicola TaxID=2718714 RepID=UPI00143B23A7|nr:hypothetical protein [Anaerosporobacter faecicola]
MAENKKYIYLTEEDLKEGRELAELMSVLGKEEKMQATIYIRALVDRNMLEKVSA